MASQVTRDEVARIAGLAQLELSTSELDTFARQLSDILAYAAIVQQADTTGVSNPGTSNPEPEPRNPGTGTSEPRNPGTQVRADQPAPSLDRDVVLAEAPDAVSGLFRVPKVL